jgi:hypothetical protein
MIVKSLVMSSSKGSGRWLDFDGLGMGRMDFGLDIEN